VTWLLVIVVIFSILYFLAVFAAELYAVCAPEKRAKRKSVVRVDDPFMDVAMNPMFTSGKVGRPGVPHVFHCRLVAIVRACADG
jgi:hypothetical protein